MRHMLAVMPERLIPDAVVPGAFHVRFGDTSQSWVDPARPEHLAFEYTSHIAVVLEHTVLDTPAEQRLRFVHVGGAGMSLPRWVAWRRPESAQIVLEPDVELTAEVRRKLPLPDRSGIKVRDVDGRRGIAAMPADYADVVIVDAFDGARVPAELASETFLADVRRVGRGDAVVVVNVTDKAPFDWARRVVAGLRAHWRAVVVGAEPSVWKGRRFGNLLLVGSVGKVDLTGIVRASDRLAFGYRWSHGKALQGWLGDAAPFTDADTVASPEPSGSKLWFA